MYYYYTTTILPYYYNNYYYTTTSTITHPLTIVVLVLQMPALGVERAVLPKNRDQCVELLLTIKYHIHTL